MEKAIILIGIPGSGKSTFYKEKLSNQYIHISLDILHTRNKEKLLLTECISKKQDFVVDNTNPTRAIRQKYINEAKKSGYQVIGYYFQSAIQECLDRNDQRKGSAFVPLKAVAHIHNILELPSYAEGFDQLFYVKIQEKGFEISDWREDSEI